MRETLKKAIVGALQKIGIAVMAEAVMLEHPADLKNGDYSSGVALHYAKQASKAPRALAEEIVAALGAVDGISKTEIAGPGFINFYLASNAIAGSINAAIQEDRWGSNTLLAGKKIMVEYTDPNPFKEFHIGHLMSNAIGESIARLYEYSGAEVRRANYQGDVGRHVARAIWGLLRSSESPEDVKALGRAYAVGATADVDGAPAQEEIIALNKKIYERNDERLNDMYDKGRAASLQHFEELYKILGTKFDFYFFESETGPFGANIVRQHIGNGVFEKSDGAVVYAGEKRNLHTRVFLNSEGLPTYEAKELGLSKMKYEKFPHDVSVIITGNEVNEYFKVLLAAMSDIFPDLAAKTVHISHGMMRLAQGKMSSRTGNVVTGESLIDDLTDVARARAKESRAEDHGKLARDISVGAIKFQILKGGASKDIIFDRERALSVEGDSGPYVQYAHARTRAIVEKAAEQHISFRFDEHAEISDLARLLHRFPEIVLRAASEREPHHVTTYLVEIASLFNRWYATEHILDGGSAQAHKVAITNAVCCTLKNGLYILGIPAPEKM